MVAPRRAPLPPAPPSPCRAPLKCGSPAPGVNPLCGLDFSRGAGGAGGGLPARRSLRPCRPARRGRRHRPPPGSLRCGPTQPLPLRLQGEKTCRNAEMHNPSRRFRRFGGGSAFLGGGQAPASSAVQKENICSHQPGVKGGDNHRNRTQKNTHHHTGRILEPMHGVSFCRAVRGPFRMPSCDSIPALRICAG